MTIETRCSIELSDILGVELKCGSCGAKTLLDTDGAKVLWDCPVCKTTWLLPQTDEEKKLRTFPSQIKSASAKMERRGFSMKLLITPPSESPE
jgi:hypothetical protein